MTSNEIELKKWAIEQCIKAYAEVDPTKVDFVAEAQKYLEFVSPPIQAKSDALVAVEDWMRTELPRIRGVGESMAVRIIHSLTAWLDNYP